MLSFTILFPHIWQWNVYIFKVSKKSTHIHTQISTQRTTRPDWSDTKMWKKETTLPAMQYTNCYKMIFFILLHAPYSFLLLCKFRYIYLVVPYFNTLLLISYALWMIHRRASEYTCKFICAWTCVCLSDGNSCCCCSCLLFELFYF